MTCTMMFSSFHMAPIPADAVSVLPSIPFSAASAVTRPAFLACTCFKPLARLYVCQRVGPFCCVHVVSILGPFRVHFGSILCPFCVHFGSILGPFLPSWVHLGSILCPFCVHFGSILPSWVHLGSILGPFWVHFGARHFGDASLGFRVSIRI